MSKLLRKQKKSIWQSTFTFHFLCKDKTYRGCYGMGSKENNLNGCAEFDAGSGVSIPVLRQF